MIKDMRLRNGHAMVLAPQQPACVESRISAEDNIFNEDNVRLSSDFVTAVYLNETRNENNNDAIEQPVRQRLCSESNSLSSRDDSVEEYEGQSSSSFDVYPHGDEYQCFSQEDVTDSDFSDDGNCGKEGAEGNEDVSHQVISESNYPGFHELVDNFDPSADNNGNDSTHSVNHLDSAEHFQKDFYNKPKFETCSRTLVQDLNIVPDSVRGSDNDLNSVAGTDNVFPEINYVISSSDHKFEFSPKEAFQESGVVTSTTEIASFESSFLLETVLFPVSGVFETTVLPDDESDVSPSTEDNKHFNFSTKEAMTCEIKEADSKEDIAGLNMVETLVCKEDELHSLKSNADVSSKSVKDSANEKRFFELEAEKNKWDNFNKCDMGIQQDVLGDSIACGKGVLKRVESQLGVITRKGETFSEVMARRTGTSKSRNRSSNQRSAASHDKKDIGVFDVYNIETAMPNIDLDAIECHLRAAREEERRRRNDREEIRRRLAMGIDPEDYYSSGRKPSLQTRLQGGMNLQICFMNDPGSDSESPNTEIDAIDSVPPVTIENMRPVHLPLKVGQVEMAHSLRPSPVRLNLPLQPDIELRTEADLFACQARLQSEARQALMQAKEMARMQMEVERQKMPLSPITQMVRSSLLKVGVPFPEDRRRLSRQILTEMNVAQLQVIINDLHSQIEVLNENLVEYLMLRDDLHMEQDSMLVDIEDLTRYIGAKDAQDGQHERMLGNNNKNRRMQATVHA